MDSENESVVLTQHQKDLLEFVRLQEAVYDFIAKHPHINGQYPFTLVGGWPLGRKEFDHRD